MADEAFKVDLSSVHVYTDGTAHIIGTSLEEAWVAYCEECGERVEDYPDPSESFKIVVRDKKLTINDDGKRETKTVREWLAWHFTQSPTISRLLCSTEY